MSIVFLLISSKKSLAFVSRGRVIYLLWKIRPFEEKLIQKRPLPIVNSQSVTLKIACLLKVVFLGVDLLFAPLKTVIYLW